MRTFAALTAGGVASIILMKVLAMLMAPVVAAVMGFVGMVLTVLKIALIGAAVYFVYTTFVRRKRSEDV